MFQVVCVCTWTTRLRKLFLDIDLFCRRRECSVFFTSAAQQQGIELTSFVLAHMPSSIIMIADLLFSTPIFFRRSPRRLLNPLIISLWPAVLSKICRGSRVQLS